MSRAGPPDTGILLSLVRTLALPLQTTGLVLIGAYALLVGFVHSMFIDEPLQMALVVSLGLPLWYATAAALSLYAQKLLLHTAQGLADERIDNATDLNPFRNSLAFKLCTLYVVVFIALRINGPELDSPLLLILVAAFPLAWLGVCLEESFFAAFRPAVLARLLLGLGLYFPAAVLCISSSMGAFAYATIWSSNVFLLSGAGYLFLLGNLLTGHLLYARRNFLYLETKKSPEQTRARDLMAEAKALDTFFHELHRFCQGGHLADAVSRLEAYIGDNAETLDPIIHERLTSFQDQRLTLEHALQYLHRAAARGERRKAWALLKWCVEREPRFRPLDGATLLDLTRAAGREDAGLVNQLLEDFAQANPDDDLIAEARFRRARVCIERLGDSATGLELLREIASDFPEFAKSDAFLRYRNRLKPK
ncbi:MAG: hypothetical protein KDI31_17790 [Pseudomonadales bacterium]|nr:hypothetical protein [Pseudomonadales bacterium]